MKKFLLLPLCMMLVFLVSCSNEDDNGAGLTDGKVRVTSVDYYGVLKVGEVADTLRCSVIYDNHSNVVEIKFSGMKFHEAMPAIDMRMTGIICTVVSTDIMFAPSDTIIPEVAVSAAPGIPSKPGVQDEGYAMTGLAGVVKDKTIELSATMPMGELVFKGNVVPLFAGSLEVLATGTETTFSLDDVLCEVELEEDGTLANLFIYGAKFAEKMPLTVDIELPGISCKHIDGGYNITVSDSLIPLVRMPGTDFMQMEAYAFKKVNGTIGDAAIRFDASMTMGVFAYQGSRFIKVINQ